MKPGITRAEFVRGALATWAAGTAAPIRAQPLVRPEPGPGPSLLDLDFSAVAQFRPFDLLPDAFAQVGERFPGAFSGRLAAMPLQAEGTPAEVSPGAEGLRMLSSRLEPTLLRTDARPVAPYATVIAELAPPGAGVQPGGTVVVGLVRDAQNRVVTAFDRGSDPANGTVGVEVVADGRATRVASVPADLSGTARFAFVVNENYVTALVARGTEWVPLTQHRITDLLDLRHPAVLREYRYGFGVGGVDAATVFAEVRAGYFGQAGLRDLHVISHADGRPLIRNRKLYFTATQAGLSFFQAAHWGVWTFDLDEPRRIEPVAHLFFERDGLVLGDHAGQIVLDEGGGGFLFAVSSWGDFAFKGVHVRYGRTSEDILSGVHVLESARMPLPTDLSAWDPGMTRIDERWYVSFVESPYQDPARGFNFRPALARSERGRPVTELTKVGADLSRGQTEGPILQKVGSRWFLLASDGDDRRYRVYDLSVNHLGFLKAPYGTNIPHPQVIPVFDEGRTTYWLITFEGTQVYEKLLGYGTHGDVIVMRAAQTRQGAEFPPAGAPRQ